VTILEQALQSSDDALLEECLAVSDQRVVDMTVERLPSVRVLPFLLRLTDKVERRPNRGMNLCIWMRAVLMKHTSYLMSVPNLHTKLAGLYQILDQRIGVFPKLLSLSGRLELALSQVSSLHEERQEASVPRTVYDEEAEEPEDPEMDMAVEGEEDDEGSDEDEDEDEYDEEDSDDE